MGVKAKMIFACLAFSVLASLTVAYEEVEVTKEIYNGTHRGSPTVADWSRANRAVYSPLTLTSKEGIRERESDLGFSFNANTEAQPHHRHKDCHSLLGLPKFTWALLCDVLALALVLLCVPLLLTCSRRRPPGAPLFDCACGPVTSAGTFGDSHGGLKAAPWMP
eukprot:gnl/TRDRNA2_/TRDRNA2_188800_c0_seq1.p1 gnl/TRDRNA2_/TRDRNA2_188800_c0~~gnl/TRDRNA2_/TRDRNA2_188800_c0_seq1.p1  ORF type:complete len:164 (-),score=17.29 gnl/TRDRNA2_/TRDRNA2_188800_c0_seq1:52-543(-)